MKIGNKEFDLKNHAYVMGILNVTPDSFSDGGKWNDKGRAAAMAGVISPRRASAMTMPMARVLIGSMI